MRHTLPVTALVCCLLLAASALAAPPQAREDADKLVLENDHVTVWFQGKRPVLTVLPTANVSDDGNATNVTGAYEYRFSEVVEFRDLNGDGAPSDNEVVASLDLDDAADWSATRNASDDGAATINMSLSAPVKMGPRTAVPVAGNLTNNVSLPDRDAEVRLVFTLQEGASSYSEGDLNLTVPGSSVKYDFEVVSWPFVDAANDRLALVAHVGGTLEIATEEGAETATVSVNGTDVGVVAWLPVAEGTTDDGREVEVTVRTSTRVEGNQTRLAHVYDVPDLATLVHEPAIGVMPTEEALEEAASDDDEDGVNRVPGVGVAAVLAVAGLAALVLGRRRA